jgi:arylsulfatase A-like enzyme
MPQSQDLRYSRRAFLAYTGAGALAARQAPNIVLILADDLGCYDLGCYGQKSIRTPHIDALAAQGLRFTQFYAGSAVCSPSRCVLVTGRHTGHATIRGNFCLAGGRVGIRPGIKGTTQVRRMHLTTKDTTVAQVLREAGYRTGLVGKWHLDGYDATATPLDRGFDEFYGWLTQTPSTISPTYFPVQRYRNRELYDVPGNQAGGRAAYETDLSAREACDFIRRNASRPFFLYMAPVSPHSPLDVPDQRPYGKQSWPEDCRTYAAMVGRLDDAVGAVLDQLKQLGLDERTVVFFASDNGPRSEPTAQLTAVSEFFDSNGPLRGYKRDLYEGGIRVPLIARWPGRTKRAASCDVPGYFADFLPTALELAGRTPPAGDGVSLVPQLLGDAGKTGDRFLYWECFEGGFKQAVRWGRWKAVRMNLAAPLELFDLTSDPAEKRNVAESNSNVVARIEAYLKTARTDSPEYPLTQFSPGGKS